LLDLLAYDLPLDNDFSDQVKSIMSQEKIIVQPEEKGERIDTFLAGKTGITRSQIQKLIGNGDILVNEKVVSQHYRVKLQDVISLRITEKKNEELVPEPIPVAILYKDNHLVVVNKPAGMVVYPAAGHGHGTLMNALSYACDHLASVGGPLRPGVVHRLDKDTSGVMVVALDDSTYYSLAEQFKERSINRRYGALVYGDLKENEGRIALNIGRSESDRKKMSTRSKRGKEAVTNWSVIARFTNAALIRVKLGTGRTHQIRVHFASIGHPVLGDRTYGKKIEIERDRSKVVFPRQMLHAELLGFIHPATGKYMEFSSPLPEDMVDKIGEMKIGE
jgi:23S rRNA pseudouridine1911/1915/1917 synthase